MWSSRLTCVAGSDVSDVLGQAGELSRELPSLRQPLSDAMDRLFSRVLGDVPGMDEKDRSRLTRAPVLL